MTEGFRRGVFKRSWAAATATLLLCSCGTFPLPRVYVLGEPSPATPSVADEAGLPHIDLMTVTVPDYVDTTDIVRRSGANEVITSSAGQWGERVSLGVTRALAVDLARQLPKVVIESGEVYEPARRLLIDVERFEIDEDGRCTLTARWRVASPDDKVQSNSEQGTFIETATSQTDAAAAMAMTRAVDQLATRIAATIRAAVN